jgi:hypothetical protein
VFEAVPGAVKAIDAIARRGAKRGIFLTVGTQDNHVDSLALPSAAVLQNFITAELRRDARGKRVATVYRGNAARQRDVRTFDVPVLTDPKTYIKRKTEPAPTYRPEPAPIRVAVAAEVRPRVVSERVPERRPEQDDLLTLLLNSVPPHQDAEGMLVNPIPQNGINAEGTHSSVTVEEGGGVTVNVTQVQQTPARGSRAERDAFTQALEGLYRAAGARGDTFNSTYAQYKGTKEIVFTAWQEGHRTYKETR